MSTRGGRQNQEVTIRVIDHTTAGGNRPSDAALGATLTTIMNASLEPALRDDRFDNWAAPDGLVLAIAEAGDEPIAFLGGGLDRGRLQLDGLLATSRADGSEGPMLALALYRSLEPSMNSSAAERIELWGKPAKPWHRAVADHHGFDELRALHQMRCTLPVDSQPLQTRAFVPGEDEERLRTVNNRAFADHPDQGGMTAEDLAAASTESWFNPDGIRLYPDPDDPDRLAGFCWTKIHEPLADGEPRLGEIYAIGIDPDHHGKGLGVPMTAAGLAWMADRGISTGMLYVEADNAPAIRTYEKLGFVRHRTDRAWSKRSTGNGRG